MRHQQGARERRSYGIRYAGPASSILRKVRNFFRDTSFQVRWRAMNGHNYTTVRHAFDAHNVSVGRLSYGQLHVIDDGGSAKLIVGSFCSVADDVVFLLSSDHVTSRVTTYPLEVKFYHDARAQAVSKGDIIVGDDCWIGYGACILSGVTLGQGSIIAARATVTRDVPPYAVVGGSPAKVIGWRFDEELRRQMTSFAFEQLDDDFLSENKRLLLTDLTDAYNLFTDSLGRSK